MNEQIYLTINELNLNSVRLYGKVSSLFIIYSLFKFKEKLNHKIFFRYNNSQTFKKIVITKGFVTMNEYEDYDYE